MSNKSQAPSDSGDGAIGVRYFVDSDVPQVLQLMRALARFEDYIDEFAVTERALRERALCEHPEFTVLLAFDRSEPEQVIGLAVCYVVPFTYTLRPELVLKELFVDDRARRSGVGRRLMRAVVEQAASKGCYRVRWLVMAGNDRARQFYSTAGATADSKWENWQLLLH